MREERTDLWLMVQRLMRRAVWINKKVIEVIINSLSNLCLIFKLHRYQEGSDRVDSHGDQPFDSQLFGIHSKICPANSKVSEESLPTLAPLYARDLSLQNISNIYWESERYSKVDYSVTCLHRIYPGY